MDNVLTRFLNRREARRGLRDARRERSKLTPEAQLFVDRLTAEIWSESGDVGEAERLTRRTLEMQGPQVGFDPATIIMIVQLCILIYKTLKHYKLLSPTPEFVGVFFDEKVEDQE